MPYPTLPAIVWPYGAYNMSSRCQNGCQGINDILLCKRIDATINRTRYTLVYDMAEIWIRPLPRCRLRCVCSLPRPWNALYPTKAVQTLIYWEGGVT